MLGTAALVELRAGLRMLAGSLVGAPAAKNNGLNTFKWSMQTMKSTDETKASMVHGTKVQLVYYLARSDDAIDCAN